MVVRGCGGSFLFLLSFLKSKKAKKKEKKKRELLVVVVQALQGLCFGGAVAGDAAEVPRPLAVELQQDDEVIAAR